MFINDRLKDIDENISLIKKSFEKNIEDKISKFGVFKDIRENEKTFLINQYIKKIEKEGANEENEDVFDLAYKLRNIGVVKFFDILKNILNESEFLSKYFQNFDIEKSNDYIYRNKILLDEKRLEFEKLHDIKKEYPLEIINIFKKIFKNDYIKSQEDVINIKNDNLIFNIQKKKLKNTILKYYNIYHNYILFTDGTNLYDEYIKYESFNDDLKKLSDKVVDIKKNIEAEEYEIKVYMDELNKNQNDLNFENLKVRAIRNFIEYIRKENMFDYYVDIFENHFEDQELFKLNTINKLRFSYYEKINQIFLDSNNNWSDFIKHLVKEYKNLIFASFESERIPFFSNIDYFLDCLNEKIIKEEIIIEYLSDLKNINSYDFNEFYLSVIEELKENNFSDGLYMSLDFNTAISEKEILKLNKENQEFINYFENRSKK